MALFRAIVYAGDFSEHSKEAFRVACALASQTRTRLIVLHVVEQSSSAANPAVANEPDSLAAYETIRAHYDMLRDRLNDYYVPPQPIDVSYHVRDGVAREEILALAKKVDADLIVLGTHGRSGLKRLLAGSVAEGVLREAHCPVLAMRSSGLASPDEQFSVILHPTDFTECAESALDVARALAIQHGARLILLHVAPREVVSDESRQVAMDPQIYREALRQMKAEFEGSDLSYPIETQLRQGDAAQQILKAAEEAGCGLIVMGSEGRSGLGRLLMGSVAEEVLRRACCPVLAVTYPLDAVSLAATSERVTL